MAATGDDAGSELAPPSEPALPSETTSADDAVANFFEGLDEDAFIADLHVVSSWDGNGSPTDGPPRDDSALSMFKSFLADEPAKRRPRDDEKRVDAKPDLGARRDPDKTRRDIERDKVNKTKETLIKKMETGLIPPGMEMEQGGTDDETKPRERDRDREREKEKERERRSPRRRRSSGSRSRSNHDGSPRRRPRAFEPRREQRERRREPERDRLRDRFRAFESKPFVPIRSRRPDPYDRRRRVEYRSRSRSRSRTFSPPRARRSSKPKEDFLSYLSKRNLIPQSNGAHPPPQPVPPPSYAPVDLTVPPAYTEPPPYVPDPGYGAVPPSQSATVTVDDGFSTMYPSVPYVLPPVEAVPQCYDPAYTITAPQEILYDGFSLPPVGFDSTFIQSNEVVSSCIQYVDNSYSAFKCQEKRFKIIKNCESVVKKLNNLQTQNCIATHSKEDLQQRDCAFTSPKRDIDYSSPLNRDSAVQYDFTNTGDKNKMIVPSIISTLQGENIHFSNIQQDTVKKDVSCQTLSSYCDRCQLKDDITKVNKQTSTISKLLYRSIHCQVREEDLASSKIIFKPNQNTLPEPEKPVSLAHMTPAQLVAELTAKAKSMQRIAVDNFRQAGGNLEDSVKRKNQFPYRETNQSNAFKSNFNNSNAISEINILDRKPRKRKPNYH